MQTYYEFYYLHNMFSNKGTGTSQPTLIFQTGTL